jgi:hypothetical protein
VHIRKVMAVMAAAAALLGGCGDSNGPGDALTPDERATLVAALGSSGLIGETGPLTFGSVIGQAGELGTIGELAASGFQIHITLTGALETEAVSSGVLAWAGLNAGTGTVETALTTGAIQDLSAFPATIDIGIGTGVGIGNHYIRATGSTYLGVAGNFSMTSASFGSMADCPNIPPAVVGFAITSCRFAPGMMEGSFEFEASRILGAGPTTFTQPATAYDVPAVRLELVIDVEAPAESRALLW